MRQRTPEPSGPQARIASAPAASSVTTATLVPHPRERLEADQGSGSFDDGERDVGLRPCPGFETTGIAAVPEHGLNKGERRAGGLERELGAVAVLNIGGVDANGEQPPVRVGQD